MRSHKRKKTAEPEFEYDPFAWQFQLMPVDEMNIEEFIAMDAYFSSESVIKKPVEQTYMLLDLVRKTI